MAVNRIGLDHPPYACATVGMMQVSPNSRNVIPGKVFFTIDFRHPDAEMLKRHGRGAARPNARRSPARSALEIDFKEIWYSPPVKFADECVAAVAQGGRGAGLLQPAHHQRRRP